MKCIVGLGNPGRKYLNTRHNLGYKTVVFFAKENRAKFVKFNSFVEIAQVKVYNADILVGKPLTFMNRSGIAVKRIIEGKNIQLDQLLVVYDDIDLDIGQIKIKPFGGSGGHKGLASVIQSLGTKKFKRLKIGIGHPGDSRLVTDYVLNPIKKGKEKEILEKSIVEANEAIKVWIKNDFARAMNQFN